METTIATETKTDLKPLVDGLVNMLLAGQVMEAFEKYYHPDVVMQEKDDVPTIGKDANREREKNFLGNMQDFRRLSHIATTYGDNKTMVEWYYDFTHAQWGVCRFFQVSVQEWQDGLIIKEKFYHTL